MRGTPSGYCPRCKGQRYFRYGVGQVKRNAKGQPYFQGKCANCQGNMLPTILNQNGAGLLSALGVPVPSFLKNIPLLGNLLF